MQFKQKNVATMLVAKNVTRNSSLTQGVRVTTSLMGDGEIIVVNPAGLVLDTSPLSENFKFVVERPDGTLKFSDMINAKSVQKVTVHKYEAGVNQVDYIGYNGTSGAIDVIDNNTYKINITLRGTDALDASRMTLKHGVYSSDDSATQEEIAAGLTKSLISNFSREAIKLKYHTDLIKFERVNSTAGTEALGASDTLVGTAGSKYVTITETGGTLPYLFAVGDYIRMGTAVTSPVYKITATTVTVADGGVLTLDIPLQTSVSYSGTGAVEYITAAEAAASNFGIKMTGCEFPYIAYKLSYGRSTWTMGLQDFGSTTITNSTKMSLGSGYGKMVNELESWIALNRDNWYLNSVAVTYPTLDSVLTGTYALIHFQYTNEDTTDMGNTNKFHKELWIACPIGNGDTYDDANTGIGPVIDAYATAYNWNISYVGASSTAAVIAVGA